MYALYMDEAHSPGHTQKLLNPVTSQTKQDFVHMYELVYFPFPQNPLSTDVSVPGVSSHVDGGVI